MTKGGGAYVKKRGGGGVVMTISRAPGSGAAKLLSYATSKGALLGMTRQLASESGEHGIAVNAISPSAFTELSRQGFAAVFKRSLFAKGLNVDPADDDMLLERSAAGLSAVVAVLFHADV